MSGQDKASGPWWLQLSRAEPLSQGSAAGAVPAQEVLVFGPLRGQNGAANGGRGIGWAEPDGLGRYRCSCMASGRKAAWFKGLI